LPPEQPEQLLPDEEEEVLVPSEPAAPPAFLWRQQDISRAVRSEPQAGQGAVASEPKTSSSNSFPHCSHLNS